MSKTMKYTIVFLIFYWAFMIYAPMANSAEIKIVSNDTISLDGVIEKDSFNKIMKLTANNNIKKIKLNSPGGLLGQGIKIGHLINSLELTTIIEDGKECHSACGLIFLSGDKRVFDGVLGIHCARLKDSETCYEPGTKKMIEFVNYISGEKTGKFFATHAWQMDMKKFVKKGNL